MKVKTSRHPDQDPERLSACRREIGPEPVLMTDANGALTRKEALYWAHRFREEWAVAWLEEHPPEAGSDSLSFVRRALIVIGLASLAAIVLFLLWFLRDIMILIFGGALLAVFLTHVSRWLADRFHFRRGIALSLVVLLLLKVVGIGTWLLAPHAIDQMGKLFSELGNALDQLRNRLQQTSWGQQLLTKMPTIISTLFAAVGGIFLLLFVGLYGSIQSRLFYEAAIKLVPPRHRQRGREILDTRGEATSKCRRPSSSSPKFAAGSFSAPWGSFWRPASGTHHHPGENDLYRRPAQRYHHPWAAKLKRNADYRRFRELSFLMVAFTHHTPGSMSG